MVMVTRRYVVIAIRQRVLNNSWEEVAVILTGTNNPLKALSIQANTTEIIVTPLPPSTINRKSSRSINNNQMM
jgi:hypothetical protein